MLKIYGDLKSGNCYKIKLLLDLMAAPHEWIHVNIMNGESRTPEFLAKNPNGKIPLLELDHGRYLSESNAILNFLAEGSDYTFDDPWLRAQILQWQFFEQYSHEPFIATSRYIIQYLGAPKHMAAELEKRVKPGHSALQVMEQHLSQHHYFVGEQYSIADITLYAYTHVADEGGFDLSPYSALNEWISRMEYHIGHKTMHQYLNF